MIAALIKLASLIGIPEKFAKAAAYAVVAIALAAGAFAVYRVVDNHFQEIRDLRDAKVTLQRANDKLNSDLAQLAKTNRDNADAAKLYRDQLAITQAIARDNREEEQKRNQMLRSIRDEIANIPTEQRQPVPPVIARTIDRLWAEGTTGKTD
jgi:hypothetical protein